MGTCLGTAKLVGRKPVCTPRSAAIHRWTTEGVRAFLHLQGESVHIPDRPNIVLHRGSWFGGDGKCTGYTPKGVSEVLKTKPAPFRHGIVRAVIKHYGIRLKYIKVSRACQILKQLGSGDDTFYVSDSCDDSEIQWTPNRVLKYGLTFQGKYAKHIVANFVGGPPDKWGTYSGTLFTLLLDRIAVVVLFEGLSALDGVIGPGERYSDYA